MDSNGKYSKVRPLGKGAMGVVHLVKRNSDGKLMVMKLIDLSKMDRKERTASLNEARVLGVLNHPNVVSYVESFIAQRTQHLCIVMELADGGDLSAKVKGQRGYWQEDQILDWFIQICLGVQYCHRKRVLHRDIKTQNIFLTADGVAKVGDFGISRVLINTMDVAHTFVGTPYYLSPEVVQEKPYDMKSDVWALGVVLYELMALRHPFNAMDMKGLMQKIIQAQYPPPPPQYSPELRALVGKMLVKDPKSRLHVQQILDLPIIKARIATWLSKPTSVPSGYIAELKNSGALRGPGDDDDVSEMPSARPSRRESNVGGDENSANEVYQRRAVGKGLPTHAHNVLVPMPTNNNNNLAPPTRKPLGLLPHPNVRVDPPPAGNVGKEGVKPTAYNHTPGMPAFDRMRQHQQEEDAKRQKEKETELEREKIQNLLRRPLPPPPVSSSPRSLPGELSPRKMHPQPVRRSHNPQAQPQHRYVGRLPPVALSPARSDRPWR